MIRIEFPTESGVFFVQSKDIIESCLLERFYPFSSKTKELDNYELLIVTIDNQLIIKRGERVIILEKIESEQERLSTIINIIRDNTIIKKKMCMMHASFVSFFGKGMLFLGESGSGKSTLSAFLNAKNQINCYSDDIVLIDDSLSVVCLSKVLSLRRPSLNFMNMSQAYEYDSFLDRYKIQLPCCLNPNQLKVDVVYSLCRGRVEQPFDSEASNPFETLLKNMYLPYSIRNNIIIAAKLMKANTVMEFHYNDLESAFGFLKSRYCF